MARNKKFRLLILVLILIALPLLVLAIKQSTQTRSNAAAADKLEAEGGTLGGNAVSKQDSLASGGSYIELGINQTSQSTGIYGPLAVGDSLNNTPIGGTWNTKSSHRFRATENSALNSIRIYIIDQTNPGYGGGTGGTMKISVQTDDGTSNHAPSGTALTSTTASNFKSGAGVVFTFPTPATLTKGTLYHIVFENIDPNPTVNFVSTDLMFQFNMDGANPQWQPGISNLDWAELVKTPTGSWTTNRGNGQGTNTPIMQLTYANGNYAGVGYIEFWGDTSLSQTKTITGTQNMVREKITVSGGDKIIDSVSIRLKRVSGTGPLNFKIEKSDGSLVDSGSIPSSQIPIVDPNNIRLSPNWVKANLSSTKTLVNAQTYYLVLSTDSNTRYSLATIRKGKAYGYGPLTYFADGNAQETSDGGATWLAPISWIQNATPRDPEADWQFYFTTTSTLTSTPAPNPTCNPSLQTAINNTASGGTLDITGCTYSLTTPVTLSKSMTLQGGTISTTTKAIVLGASDITISGVHIIGPQSTSFNSMQNGIYYDGTTIQNITIKNNNIENFGQSGIWIGNINNLNISGNTIKNMVYAGIMIISGNGGTISNNNITNIGITGYEANGMNAYGIALTDTAGTPSTGITISGNTIDNVPQWHGLDTHGGRNLIFSGNIIHRTNRAIFLTGSDSTNGSVQNITINNNTMDTPTKRIDVINTYPYNEVGITVVAGSINVSGTGNKFDGWPSGNHIDTQSGPNNFTNNVITNPK